MGSGSDSQPPANPVRFNRAHETNLRTGRARLISATSSYSQTVSNDDHVQAARDVYDASAHAYVEFVGTEISPASEGPVDRALIGAFIELIRQQEVAQIADVGCGPGRVARLLADCDLDVIGIDVSEALLSIARDAHPDIKFRQGQCDSLPLGSGALGGIVSWYSMIFTPPDRLSDAFEEFARVLAQGGVVLLAFQANGQPLHRQDAFGTGRPLTSYQHNIEDVTSALEEAGFDVYATTNRAADLPHETGPQGFIIARMPAQT